MLAEGATGCAGVYAGGDCINGGKEVVNAVADGDAAQPKQFIDLSRERGKMARSNFKYMWDHLTKSFLAGISLLLQILVVKL